MEPKTQQKAPLYDALMRHREKSRGNFHVPGHKQGRAFDAEARVLYRELLTLDLTEIGDLDDLHQAEGVIREAQELAAEAFGADRTFFLVGGSTAGNLAMILGSCRPGERLLVHRSSHQSVFHGCMLAGVRPVFIKGRGAGPLGGSLEPGDLDRALDVYADVKGVVVTSPDYFGRTQPLSELAAVCHRHGVPLLVDEAHGAHFGFHPDLPAPALSQGADGVVQSTHKMLPAMTMSSMLHLRGHRLDPERIRHGLKIIQSSSPSYPLMASLDLARRFMVTRGEEELGRVLKRIRLFREQISRLVHLVEYRFPESDPLKVCIGAHRPVTGYRLLRWLEDRKMYLEMADHEKVLAVFSPGTEWEEVDRLMEWLEGLDDEIPGMEECPPFPSPDIPVMRESEVSYEQLRTAEVETVPLQKAGGRLAARTVVSYPPGVPLLLPGERVRREQTEEIARLIRQGGRVRGLASGFPVGVYVIK
ncbi:arginine/lysine/ornithine decarboxylase [Melghirimyces profundicolus]|uniref:Arginine/lysine/ornithine decarboxylase n=1 Tax=Melghirimyces profundicolus TaxID=1242148 RepID=A0A2T6BGN1_9BACL|nr:aminotransferase class I/II-fold pyridoxal phosphate-dependent enzyme [Melghirimyces profundicolus]PTX55210.1 arginine/lysine/ornithine decarboxylase [Melghirimyces profundicolus]